MANSSPGMRLRQRQRLRRMLAAGAGDHHLRHAGVARALQHRVAVVVEAVVGEVGADVDQVHAAFSVRRADRDRESRIARIATRARSHGATRRILARMPSPEFPITPLLPRDPAQRWPRIRAWCWKRRPAPARPRRCRWRCSTQPWLARPQDPDAGAAPRRRARGRRLHGRSSCGEAVGDTVGYRIRFENKVSAAHARSRWSPKASSPACCRTTRCWRASARSLFDEFHERHLAGDLGLALALDVQAQLREDLRIVVMSATLDGERLARFLDAPRLSSAGRSYPVTVAHFPARRDEALEAQARRAVEQALAAHPGDVLVFLPGQREIARAERGAGRRMRSDAHVRRCLPLHGELPVEQQSRVLQPDPRRPPPRRAGHQRRRIQRDPARRARGDRQRPGARAALRPQQRLLAAGSRSASRRPRPTSAPAAPAASPKAGRYRLWPQSQRLEPQRRAGDRAGRTGRAGAGTRGLGQRRPALRRSAAAGRAGGGARSAAAARRARRDRTRSPRCGRRMLALGTHPRLAAMLLSAPSEPTSARWPATSPRWSKRAIRCAARGDALAARWQALAAFRSGRVAGRRASRRAGRDRCRPRSNGAAACACDAPPPRDVAGARARRPARACLPRPHRAPASAAIRAATSWPTAAWRACSTTARCTASRGSWPANCASRPRDALVLRARAGRRGAPARATSRSASSAKTTRALGRRPRARWSAQRERRFDRIVLDSKPGRTRRSARTPRGADRRRARARAWTRCRGRESLRQWRERVRCLRDVDAGAGPARSVRRRAAGDARRLAAARASPARRGSTRWARTNWRGAEVAARLGAAPAHRRSSRRRASSVPSGMERRIDYAHGAARRCWR